MAEHCYMEVQGIMGFSQSEADFADAPPLHLSTSPRSKVELRVEQQFRIEVI